MPENSPPAVHAGYMKNLFAALEERGHLAQVNREDAELLQCVEAALRVAWLPVELNIRTVEAVATAFGAHRGLGILAECVYAQFDTPLWENFVGGALRLLGRDPGSLGRWIPHAMKLVFRNCGTWSAERSGATQLTVRVTGLPQLLANHGLWLESLALGMTPIFTLCGTGGASNLVEVDAALGKATYRLRWKPRD